MLKNQSLLYSHVEDLSCLCSSVDPHLFMVAHSPKFGDLELWSNYWVHSPLMGMNCYCWEGVVPNARICRCTPSPWDVCNEASAARICITVVLYIVFHSPACVPYNLCISCIILWAPLYFAYMEQTIWSVKCHVQLCYQHPCPMCEQFRFERTPAYKCAGGNTKYRQPCINTKMVDN